MLYFEDFPKGRSYPLSEYTITQQRMIAFASEYDPQYYHTDPEAATQSVFGGLIGSGWMTTAIFMRMQCDSFLSDSACLGSPGVDKIRWLQPTRPGDTLHGTNDVVDATPSRSKPDRGSVIADVTLFNQHDEVVMTLTTRAIFRKRPDEAADQ